MKKIILIILIFLLAGVKAEAQVPQKNVTQVQVKKVEGKVQWRRHSGSWKTILSGDTLDEPSEIKNDDKGNLTLQFSEGSVVDLKADSEIELESLHDPQNQPLIWIRVKNGEIHGRIASFDSYRGFSINTEPALIVVDQGTPSFSVNQDQKSGLTTLAVEEGTVMIQPENPEIQPINLGAG